MLNDMIGRGLDGTRADGKTVESGGVTPTGGHLVWTVMMPRHQMDRNETHSPIRLT